MRDGWPIGVVMSYVWCDGKIWVTASSQRPRIAAVRRDKRVSVAISSAGTSVSAHGHDSWTMPNPRRRRNQGLVLSRARAGANTDDRKRHANFIKILESPRRVVIYASRSRSTSPSAPRRCVNPGVAAPHPNRIVVNFLLNMEAPWPKPNTARRCCPPTLM